MTGASRFGRETVSSGGSIEFTWADKELSLEENKKHLCMYVCIYFKRSIFEHFQGFFYALSLPLSSYKIRENNENS